jgi:uncharacterized membrane protein (DUF485 family)
MAKLFITAVVACAGALIANYMDFLFVNHDWKANANVALGILIGVGALFLGLVITRQYGQGEYMGDGSGDSGF